MHHEDEASEYKWILEEYFSQESYVDAAAD